MWTVVVLPAPFGPEQREHAGGGDVEVERVEHELVAEGLGQPFELDGGGHEVTEVSERWTLIEA